MAFIGNGAQLTDLDAGDIASGTLPLARGGTGTTNTVNTVVAGSGISVSTSGTQVTVSSSGGGVTSLNGQTGAITNTDLGAIGSYIGSPWAVSSPGSNQTSNFGAGGTISGSSLRYNYTKSFSPYTGGYAGIESVQGGVASAYSAGGTSLSGTWRCVSSTSISTYAVGKSYYGTWHIGLWVRIS